MANYETLKAAINAAIYTNTHRAITGDILKAKMDEMIDALGTGWQYMGIAVPSTSPGTPDYNVAYLANTAGTYSGLGELVLVEGEVAFLKYNGAWTKDTIIVNGGDVPENCEVTDNKVTTISAASTDIQYPSAKAVYDYVEGLEDIIGDIDSVIEHIEGDDDSQGSE